MIQKMEAVNPLENAPASAKAMDERARLKEYADRWKVLGPLLEAQREEDVRRANIFGSYSFFAGMILKNIRDFPPGPESGLIEQQVWFRKLHPTYR